MAVPFNPSLPLSAEQQQALANIDAYLNSFSLLEGKFIQIAPNGNQSDGVFFISRPGKIRFHFNPPSQVDIIAVTHGHSDHVGDTAALSKAFPEAQIVCQVEL